MKKKLIFILTFGMLLCLIIFGKTSIQAAFAAVWFTATLLCMGLLHYSFQDLLDGSIDYAKQAISPMLFLFCAGTMTGIWNQCGTIPAMTRLGLYLIRPDYFQPIAYLLCFCFAYTVGTSFGTVGTMGVVCISIGNSLGLPPVLCANTVIMGSFTGFLFSPLADCINISSSLAELPVPKVSRAVGRIAIPTSVLAILLVIWRSRNYTLQMSEADLILARETLSNSMKLGFITLFPVILVLVLMFFHLPSILALMCGTLSALPVAVLYQHQSLQTALDSMWKGAVHTTDSEWFNGLFTRGGISGMTGTIILFIGCFSLFGLLNKCGIMDEMLRPLIKRMRGPRRTMWFTALIAFVASFCSASGMCGIIFTLNLLLPVYKAKGYALMPQVVATVVGSMYLSCCIPWHSNVVTPAAFMGVEPTALAAGNTGVFLSLGILLLLTVLPGVHEKYMEG